MQAVRTLCSACRTLSTASLASTSMKYQRRVSQRQGRSDAAAVAPTCASLCLALMAASTWTASRTESASAAPALCPITGLALRTGRIRIRPCALCQHCRPGHAGLHLQKPYLGWPLPNVHASHVSRCRRPRCSAPCGATARNDSRSHPRRAASRRLSQQLRMHMPTSIDLCSLTGILGLLGCCAPHTGAWSRQRSHVSGQ